MSSCISFGFLCGNPCCLCSYACLLIPTPCPRPCREETERKLTAHLLFKTWISERKSLDVTKRVLAKKWPITTTFPNLEYIWNHSEGWRVKQENPPYKKAKISTLSGHWIFIDPQSWESQPCITGCLQKIQQSLDCFAFWKQSHEKQVPS